VVAVAVTMMKPPLPPLVYSVGVHVSAGSPHEPAPEVWYVM